MQRQGLRAGRSTQVRTPCLLLHAPKLHNKHVAGRHVAIIPDIFRHQLRKLDGGIATRKANTAVRAAAAAQEAIDIDAEVIDDRIPVTASHLPAMHFGCLLGSSLTLPQHGASSIRQSCKHACMHDEADQPR